MRPPTALVWGQTQPAADARSLRHSGGQGKAGFHVRYLSRESSYNVQKRSTTTVKLTRDAAPTATRVTPTPAPPSSLLAPLTSRWNSLPASTKLTVVSSGAFIISNMDKVILTVAIIPLAEQLGWSPSTAGLVQSAFFYGFMLMQVPGGYLSSLLGGQSVLPVGLSVWSAATAAVPFVAHSLPVLLLSRAVVGVGEAVAPTAVVDMLAKTVPKEKRASSVSFAFAGLHVGSIVGLVAAPLLINWKGWEALFITCGSAGLLWSLWFNAVLEDIKKTEPEVAHALSQSICGGTSSSMGSIPYRAFLRSKSVQALMFTHFCNNWFHYTMLAWLPTYFTQTLSIDLMHAAQTALFPPLAGIAASAAAGSIADCLINKGWTTSHVRRLAQGTAFLGPAVFLLAACLPDVADNNTLLVASITAALGLSSFSLAGLYCTHQDLSPKYASALLGLTNTAGAVPGILGVTTVGFLYDQTQSWELALFLPSVACLLAGAGVYTFLCRNDAVDFDAPAANAHFKFETALKQLGDMAQKQACGWMDLLQSKLPYLSTVHETTETENNNDRPNLG